MTTVRDAVAALDVIAPSYLALDGDPTGLLVGDPNAILTGIVACLDVTQAVVQAAAEQNANLIVAHHPLIYNKMRAVCADEAHPGAVVRECIRRDINVACAHTCWDIASGGVNDVLADLVGLTDTRPVRTTYREALAQIVVFVPQEAGLRDKLLDAMGCAGAGHLSNSLYERCGFWAAGEGTFRPLPGADPHIGTVGTPEVVHEDRMEMIVPVSRVSAVVSAAKAAHPYEEMAYGVYPLQNTGATFGLGRIGDLASGPITGHELVQRVKDALTFDAVRAAGPLDKPLQRVAVGGGACAELVPDAIALGADALVTSDVRHHESIDALARGFLLIDAGHAQTETPGARELGNRLQAALPDTSVTFSRLSDEWFRPSA